MTLYSLRCSIHIALLALCLGACAAPSAKIAAEAVPTEASTYVEKSLQVERLIIGGQPAKQDVAALKAAGVVQVINLRTPEEMASLGYDEAATFAALGIEYQQLALGGSEYPYSPAVLEAFAAQMAAAPGRSLLHCASGGRAGMVYAAWLVKYGQQTPDQALRSLQATGAWPLPLEKLLGRPLTVEFAQ